MIRQPIFKLYYSQTLHNDAVLIKQLINNLDYTIEIAYLSKFDSKIEYPKSLIFLLNVEDYQNFKNEFLVYIEKKTNLFLINTVIHNIEKASLLENILFYSQLINNNSFAEKIFELTSKINSEINTNGFDDIKLYQETLKVYSNISFADSYYEKWNNELPYDKLDRFAQLIKPKGKILDAGCGPGHHAIYLSKYGFNTIGIDLSLAAINIAKSHSNGNTHFYVANTISSGFKDNTFDGIWSCAVLIHFPLNLLVLQLNEFYRILRFSGIIAITIGINKRKHTDIYGRYFNSNYSIHDIQAITNKSGFRILDIENSITWNSTQKDLLISNWLTITLKK